MCVPCPLSFLQAKAVLRYGGGRQHRTRGAGAQARHNSQKRQDWRNMQKNNKGKGKGYNKGWSTWHGHGKGNDAASASGSKPNVTVSLFFVWFFVVFCPNSTVGVVMKALFWHGFSCVCVCVFITCFDSGTLPI